MPTKVGGIKCFFSLRNGWSTHLQNDALSSACSFPPLSVLIACWLWKMPFSKFVFMRTWNLVPRLNTMVIVILSFLRCLQTLEKQAAHRNARVEYSSVDSSKNWTSLRTRVSRHKCMVENWWSLTIEVATDAIHCVELLSMFSKILSKLHENIMHAVYDFSYTIISERHIRGMHKIRRSNSGLSLS